MQGVYQIPFAKQPEEHLLCAAPRAWLENWYPVEGKEYCPRTFGQILRTPFALYVRLVCEEKSPQAVQWAPNSPVCTDSCLEFFLNPVPEENRFINFELNSRGTMLMGLNEDGDFRCLDPALQAGCFPQSLVDEEHGVWEVRFCIPDSLLCRIFPGYDPNRTQRMSGNFYKCGDHTAIPHYGSWNPVSRRPIDFHCPECFGEFVLDK